MKVSLSLAYDDCACRMLRDWGCRAPIAKSRTSGKTNPISTKSTAGWHLIPGKRRPSSNNYINVSIQNNSLARVRVISALTIFSFFQSAFLLTKPPLKFSHWEFERIHGPLEHLHCSNGLQWAPRRRDWVFDGRFCGIDVSIIIAQ